MKRIVKKVILGAFSRVSCDDGGKIIYYHDVHRDRPYTRMSTALSVVRSHVETIRQMGYKFVSGTPASDLEVQMCFDDGFHGLWECRDYFIQEGLSPTVYISVDLIGQDGYLTWAEILQLQGMGFLFQSHTWSHRPLVTVAPLELGKELLESRIFLSDRLQSDVSQICFPCGMFSSVVLKAAKRAGYKELVTSVPGSTRSTWQARMFAQYKIVPRILVQDCSTSEIRYVMRGALNYFAKHFLRLHFQPCLQKDENTF